MGTIPKTGKPRRRSTCAALGFVFMLWSALAATLEVGASHYRGLEVLLRGPQALALSYVGGFALALVSGVMLLGWSTRRLSWRTVMMPFLGALNAWLLYTLLSEPFRVGDVFNSNPLMVFGLWFWLLVAVLALPISAFRAACPVRHHKRGR